MKYVRGSNWIIAGILSAICFTAFALILHMGIFLAILLAVLVFVGSVLFFMPQKYIVGGIDITKAHNKAKAERDIIRWQEQIKKLQQISDMADSAYLNIKINQMLDVVSCIFDAITNDVTCLVIAQRFCERYLTRCFTLAERYRQADKAADATGGEGYQKQKEYLRSEMEALISFFQNHLAQILSGDGKELTEAIRLVSETKKQEAGQ